VVVNFISNVPDVDLLAAEGLVPRSKTSNQWDLGTHLGISAAGLVLRSACAAPATLTASTTSEKQGIASRVGAVRLSQATGQGHVALGHVHVRMFFRPRTSLSVPDLGSLATNWWLVHRATSLFSRKDYEAP
jgi:hypothetical protein